MGKNEKSMTEAKLELGKMAIESVTSLLTLALTNSDKANERLHASLTCENNAAVQAIAERELELAESMFERAFAMADRLLRVQEKEADARLREARRFEGYRSAMDEFLDDEDSDEDDVAAS